MAGHFLDKAEPLPNAEAERLPCIQNLFRQLNSPLINY
jgi:hypothetical protein